MARQFPSRQRGCLDEKSVVQVFADEDAAEAWFGENDAEGVAFEYPVKAVRREGLV